MFDLFLSPDFFAINLESLREWKVIVDNLMTQDQVTFRDLLNRLHSTTTSGVVNLFSSLDQVQSYIPQDWISFIFQSLEGDILWDDSAEADGFCYFLW